MPHPSTLNFFFTCKKKNIGLGMKYRAATYNKHYNSPPTVGTIQQASEGLGQLQPDSL